MWGRAAYSALRAARYPSAGAMICRLWPTNGTETSVYPSRPMSPKVFALMFAVTAFGSLAHAADPQPYRVDIASVGDGNIDATLKDTSDLQSLRKTAPVSPFGLIARARSDVDRLKTTLESFGYYQSTVTIKINGTIINNPGLGDVLSALPKGEDAQVAIAFVLGPQYHLGRIDIDGDLPEGARG